MLFGDEDLEALPLPPPPPGLRKPRNGGVPKIVQIVVGIEWLVALSAVVCCAISACFQIGRYIQKTNATISNSHEPEASLEDLVFGLAISVSIILLNLAFTLLLGRGVDQQSTRKCLVWLLLTTLLVSISISAFEYFLFEGYFENWCFVLACFFITYKIFTIVVLIHFLTKLTSREDEY